MNKKRILAIAAVLVLAFGVYVWQTSEGSPEAKEEAIRQAQAYRSNENCTAALVPAVHKASGAKYTFTDGCLAPGWEPEN